MITEKTFPHSNPYRRGAVSLIVLLFSLFSGLMLARDTHAAPKINRTSITIKAKSAYKLTVSGTKKPVSWSSSNPKVASVSSAGRVYARKGGICEIRAHVKGYPVMKCRVKVKSLVISKSSLLLVKGRAAYLKAASVNLSGPLVWRSSAPSVISVSQNGRVYARKAGKAVISATRGEITATCTVLCEAVRITPSSMSIAVGETQGLSVSGTSSSVRFKSGDPEIATVSSTGRVTGRSVGQTDISAVVGSCVLKCRVTVFRDKWDQLLERYRTDPQTNQLLLVKYTGGSDCIAELYSKTGGSWQRIFSCPGNVGTNGIDKQVEGDERTPTGTFNLTSGFGILPDPGSANQYLQVQSWHYWCADPEYYNQLIDIRQHPHDCQGEHLIDYQTAYQYGMFLDYNKECVYKKGCAIFLHCMSGRGATLGCVAVPKDRMIEILRYAGPGAKICIYPA